jgi:DUF1680 family protein
VGLTVSKSVAGEYGLFLRVPGWAGRAEFQLNGRPLQPPIEKGYAVLRRAWADGDTIDVRFPMAPQFLEANPGVADDRGRVALRRGPIIYCFEQADNAADVDRLVLPLSTRMEAQYEPGLLKGVAVITGQAKLKPTDSWEGQLYRPAEERLEGPVAVRAVPYCTWSNRGPGKMAVWVDAAR